MAATLGQIGPGLLLLAFPQIVFIHVRGQIGGLEAEPVHPFRHLSDEGVKPLVQRAFGRTNLSRTVGKAHAGAVYVLHLAEGLLRAGGAGPAGHAVYTKPENLGIIFHGAFSL